VSEFFLLTTFETKRKRKEKYKLFAFLDYDLGRPLVAIDRHVGDLVVAEDIGAAGAVDEPGPDTGADAVDARHGVAERTDLNEDLAAINAAIGEGVQLECVIAVLVEDVP